MATGIVEITTLSVDYPNLTRGTARLINRIQYDVDADGYITFTHLSAEHNWQTWGICASTSGSGYGVWLQAQVSYDNGGTWNTLDGKFATCPTCPSLLDTIAMSQSLVSQFGRYKLNGDCMLRFLYYANRNPAPSQSLPNAFPNESYSAAVQVPAYVDVSWDATLVFSPNGGTSAPGRVTERTEADSIALTIPDEPAVWAGHTFKGWDTDRSHTEPTYHPGDTFTVHRDNPEVWLFAIWAGDYRPGAIRINGEWKSLNRDGGACNILDDGWKEMRTDSSDEANPPQIKTNGEWKNMTLIEGND